MEEKLLSVGIDIGTSTTQMVISRFTLINTAAAFAVPRIKIAEKEILFRSRIHFTPLLSDSVIDAVGVKRIVEEEYLASGIDKSLIQTGAVIITGETARKENAREVLEALSSFAGDFVVATAGPDLESVLAAKGAGADLISKERRNRVLNFDVGGGTTNLAIFDHGELADTGCLDIGGRLIKLDSQTAEITYISRKVAKLIEILKLPIAVGDKATPESLGPIITAMVTALEQSAGLRRADHLLYNFTTHKTVEGSADCFTFSGGVADLIYDEAAPWLTYGDIGVLLGRAIRKSMLVTNAADARGRETIRATVVGAGAHSTDISGSTICYSKVNFPLRNLAVLKLSLKEEGGNAAEIASAIQNKLGWFSDESGTAVVILGLTGEKNPSFVRIGEYAKGIAQGMSGVRSAENPLVVVVEQDMGKALGQAIQAYSKAGEPILCLDGIAAETGSYMDIGAPVADGNVVPVIIKTLIFTS